MIMMIGWDLLSSLHAFTPLIVGGRHRDTGIIKTTFHRSTTDSQNNNEWKGDVVSSSGGKIQGCSLQQVEGSTTEFIIHIDGVEADLGRFSEAIYKKLIADAKQQRFQGFRPGTIPPHLEPTYRAFAMDECARETVLEAMQQNNIRPFTSARTDMTFDTFCIPPPVKKAGSKKKKSGRKAKETAEEPQGNTVRNEEPTWLTFETMKEALDAGWRPGQSFSFVARSVKGQKVKEVEKGATPLGQNY